MKEKDICSEKRHTSKTEKKEETGGLKVGNGKAERPDEEDYIFKDKVISSKALKKMFFPLLCSGFENISILG